MKCCTKMDIQAFSDVLSLVSQPNRLQIICLLGKEGELCVCEIIEQVGLKQNLVSHHLGLLKDIGLLTTRREGKNIFYKLDAKYFAIFQKNIQHIFNF